LRGSSQLATYGASKKFSELALWEWAEQHPHVEVTTCADRLSFSELKG
jgi:nucleoside-diphosphate-sugar epimerase